MTLVPRTTLTLGSRAYATHLSGVVVELGILPSANLARCTLPPNADVTAAPGDSAELTLDSGEDSQTVLTGSVASVTRGFDALVVTLSDASAVFASYRPALTWERQSAADVIRALARDVSATAGSIDVNLDLAAYAAHQERTAAEHIAELSALGGAIASITETGELSVRKRPARAELALKYGREFVAYRARSGRASAAQRFRIGSGPAGSPSAPNALRPSVAPLPSNAGKPGLSAVWRAAAALRSPSVASSASQAETERIAAAAERVFAQCFLLPSLRPGLVVEVQDLPAGVSGGPWLVTQVTHRLFESHGRTSFSGESAGALAFGGALGAALGALG